MSSHVINAMNQQEHSHFNPTHPDHTDSFSANFEQRKYLQESNSFERRAVWNSSSSSCCQPSQHHSRHGEPLYRSLLKPHHCSQTSFTEHVEGLHQRHHKHYLFEAESNSAGNCFSPQDISYSPCRCGTPMLHESTTRIGSKGQNYYPNRALPNEITLYNWYLIRSGGSHTSDIAIGGFLSSRCTELDRIETTTIVKRLEGCKLLTKDGDVINVVGPIDDYRTVSNGFTLQTAHLFISGFPHIWNLLVGMGLPAKAAVTTISSQNCDFHGGEIMFQERSQKENSGQKGYMQHFSAFKGVETDPVSSPNGGRGCGLTKAQLGTEANEKIPDSAVVDFGLRDCECQSKEDPLNLQNQVQEKEADKGLQGNCVERREHEASLGEKYTIRGPVEATDLMWELDITPIENMEAEVSEIAFGNKESEVVTEKNIKDDAKEKKHADEAFVESSAEAVKRCDGNPDLAMVQMNEGAIYREFRMETDSKTGDETSARKRKVSFSSPNEVEGGDLSSSLSLENSARSMAISHSLFSQNEEELISSALSIENQKGAVAKKAAAKKGKHKRKRRVLLARSKRLAKTKVQLDLKMKADAIKQLKDPSHKEQLDSDFRKRKSGKVREGQVAAVSESDLHTARTAEDHVLDPMPVIRRREDSLQKLGANKEVQSKSNRKDDGKFFAKSQDSIRQTCSEHLAEATDLACERDNLPIDSMEAAVFVIPVGNKESEVGTKKNKKTIKNVGKESKIADEACAEADQVHGGNLDVATVQPFQTIEGEVGTANLDKTSNDSSSKKRKGPNPSYDVKGGSYILEIPTRSMEKSGSLFTQNEEDLTSSIISIGKQKDAVAKKGLAQKKGKHKRRGRVLLARSKRPAKRLGQVDFKKKADTVKQSKESSCEKQPDGCIGKLNNRTLREGQVAAVAESDLPMGKAVEQVSDPALVIRREEPLLQKLKLSKGIPIKSMIKGNDKCSAKSQDAIRQTRLKMSSEKSAASEVKDLTLTHGSLQEICSSQREDDNGLSSMTTARKKMKQMLPPPLPSPLMSVSKQLVSKAFGLKTSKSGRLLVPPLAHWRGQSLVRDMDGGIIAIEDGSHGTSLETGCFNFKPPIEARAKKLQEWLSETASKCLIQKLNARRKGNRLKSVFK